MVKQSAFDLSVSNFVDSYLSLAHAVESTQVTRGHNCTVVRSPIAHALGNFAICPTLDRSSAFDVWRLSQDATVFQVYVPVEESVEQQLLLERGFQYQQSLELMVLAGPAPAPDTSLCVLEVEPHMRPGVAEFMTGIFFKQQNGSERERTAQVIGSASLKMYGAWDPFVVKTVGTMIGAMSVNMLADSIGIYNLCVRSAQQRHKIGSSMVTKFAGLRFVQGRPLVLQCNESLLPFYTRLGFQSVGRVEIFHKRV